MSALTQYQISHSERIIKVTLTGEWNPAIDLRYMSELSDAIKTINRKKWALLVDFSQCHIHANNIASAISDSIYTDRRNQALEVWVVNRADQGDFLLNFGSTRDIKIHKCFCWSEGHRYLQKHGFH